jgi:hypothetical protein
MNGGRDRLSNLWPLLCAVKNGLLNGAVPRSLPRSIPESSFPQESVGDRCGPVVMPQLCPKLPTRLQPLHPLKTSRAASCVSRSSELLSSSCFVANCHQMGPCPTGQDHGTFPGNQGMVTRRVICPLLSQ